jgi:YMGG-like Gly-zipper
MAGKLSEALMYKVIAIVVAGLTVAGCTQTEKGAAVGAASGAVIGGIVSNDVRGAAVGAAIGGVLGAVAAQPGQCYYRDQWGRRYIDDCRYRHRTKVVVRY